jgi:hypothetical protein
VAVAIKAEFHTIDLAELHSEAINQQSEVKNEAAASISGFVPVPQLNERERGRLDELFLASRSLLEPMELDSDVTIIGFLIYSWLFNHDF